MMLGFLWTRQYQFSNKIELHQVLTESHEPNFLYVKSSLTDSVWGPSYWSLPRRDKSLDSDKLYTYSDGSSQILGDGL